jgi:hypothetical protein
MLRDLTISEEFELLKDSIVSLMLLDNENNPIWLKQIKEKIQAHPELIKELYHYKGDKQYTLLDISVGIGNPYLFNIFAPYYPNWKEVIGNEFYHCMTNMSRKDNFPIMKNLVESFYHIKLIDELPLHILPTFMQNCFLVENKHFFNLALERFLKNNNIENHLDLPIMLTNMIEKASLKTILYSDYFDNIWKYYDIDYVNMAGKNILNLAIEKQNFALADYLLNQQASIDYVGPNNLNSFELFFKVITEDKINYYHDHFSNRLFHSFLEIIQDDYQNLRDPKRFNAIFDKIKNYENQPQKSLIQSYYMQLEHIHFFESFEKIKLSATMKPVSQIKEKVKVKI